MTNHSKSLYVRIMAQVQHTLGHIICRGKEKSQQLNAVFAVVLKPSSLQLDTNTYRNSSISICHPLPFLVKCILFFPFLRVSMFCFPCSLTVLANKTWLFLFGGFPKMGWYPQIIHFNRVFHYKPSILGYPYFWKHPFVMTVSLGSEWTMAMTIHVSLLSGSSASLRAPWAAQSFQHHFGDVGI